MEYYVKEQLGKDNTYMHVTHNTLIIRVSIFKLGVKMMPSAASLALRLG
jgi:hypothetical protein